MNLLHEKNRASTTWRYVHPARLHIHRNHSRVDLAAEEMKTRDLEADWRKNIVGKDADKLVSIYTDDATFMMPGIPAAKGKENIKKVVVAYLADPNLKIDANTERVEVGKSGDVAFSQGTYQMTMSDPKTKKPIIDKGSYVTGYKKQADGSWKAVSDINVSEMAPGSGS